MLRPCLLLPLQVVVLAGGTNDFHILPPPALEDWLPSFMDLINMVSNIPSVVVRRMLVHHGGAEAVIICVFMHSGAFIQIWAQIMNLV